ncbi:MAG: hypothetical protein AAF548_04755 [Actinomycetota bacterium]
MTTESLEARLRDLRERIEPTDVDIRLDLDPDRRRATGSAPIVRAAAIVIIVVFAAVLAIAPARTAVADWLGIGSTAVTIDAELPATSGPEPPAAPTDDPAETVASDASAALGVIISLPLDAELGDPTGWEIRDRGDFEELVVEWPAVRLTAWPADVGAILRKVTTNEPVRDARLDTDGEPALWITGPHVRIVGVDAISEDATLLWIRDGVEYRLSGVDLTLDRAIEIAATQP